MVEKKLSYKMYNLNHLSATELVHNIAWFDITMNLPYNLSVSMILIFIIEFGQHIIFTTSQSQNGTTILHDVNSHCNWSLVSYSWLWSACHMRFSFLLHSLTSFKEYQNTTKCLFCKLPQELLSYLNTFFPIICFYSLFFL